MKAFHNMYIKTSHHITGMCNIFICSPFSQKAKEKKIQKNTGYRFWDE